MKYLFTAFAFFLTVCIDVIAQNTNQNDALAKQYFISANKHAEEKSYDVAINEYSSSIRLAPDNRAPYLGRATCYRYKKEYLLSYNDCIKSVDLDPSFDKAKTALKLLGDDVHVDFLLKGLEKIDMKQRGEYFNHDNYQNLIRIGIMIYSKLVEIFPKEVENYRVRADMYFESGKNTLALQDYNTAIQLNSNFARDYAERGKVYAELNKTDLAIQDLLVAIKLEPRKTSHYSNLASIYEKIGRNDLAIRYINTALSFDPNNIFLKYDLERLKHPIPKSFQH